MNKIFISLIVLLSIPFVSFGKGIKVQFLGGLGTYSMSDMKDMDRFIVDQIPLPLHETKKFPAYWFYKGALLFNVSNNFSFGPMYAFHSTGSRYSLADYSGKYYYDDLIHAHSLGLKFDYSILTNFILNCGVYLDGGMSFSKVQFKEHLELTEIEDQYTDNTYAKATSYFIEPGIYLKYPLKIIEPGLHIGYLFPILRKGLKEDESEQYLYLPWGEKAKSGWNGFRLSISITIPF